MEAPTSFAIRHSEFPPFDREPIVAAVREFLDAPDGTIEHGTYAVFICRAGIAIARALGAVHKEGLLHRDVKPSNILLRRDGTP